ncbi:hypothetical protein MKW94_028359 [Papaver nudicaule]|uniref:Uncharacterized protein n=1 Tax=Papaver nudicaule TaxID=74823 RepID=A0AA41VX40_PAPNU|nr:hypothetical protein [Papaver nudicaule]
MGLFQSNTTSSVGIFLFAMVGYLALMIQMPCTEAVLECAANERYVSKTYKGVWQLTQCEDSCPREIQSLYMMKCNWWDPRTGDTRDEYSTCEGCCGESSSSTPPPAITRDQCQAGERSKTYSLPASRPWNCGLCEDKCKAECGPTQEELTREMCALIYAGEAGPNSYKCRCCCKNKPPTPSPPPPPPPCTPPPPCAPSENTCDNAKDLYLAFQLPSTGDCDLCLSNCEKSCSKLGRSMPEEWCIRQPSAVFCRCCCTGNPSSTTANAKLSSIITE